METNQAIDALAALAQETRLGIFRALVQAHSPADETAGLPAGEIASRVGIAPATASFHLKELSRAGLIRSRRAGRSIIYCADFSCMVELVRHLLEDCCGGACGVSVDELIDGRNR